MGKLIVFEGIDRAGKSTQLSKLVNKLRNRGYTVDTFVFPTHNSTGSLLRKALSGQESLNPEAMHLLFSADRYQAKYYLNEMIKNNDFVILDRYYFSGIAYSVSNGVDRDWCHEIDSNLPKPDHVIYLDIDPSEAAKRSEYGECVFDNVEFQSKVRQAYLNMIDETWQKINVTNLSIEEISDTIILNLI